MDQDKPQNAHVDVSARRVAHVYAEALIQAASKEGQLESVLEEFDSLINDLFAQDQRLEGLLSAAALGRRARGEIIDKAFKGRASDVFLNFLTVLNDHDRLELLRPILQEAKKIYNDQKGVATVRVTSAVPLTDEQRAHLIGDLKEKFNLQPFLEEKVDPDLLGGLIVRVGDWQYDASVRTRIENLRHLILARSSHEIQSRRNSFSHS